MFSESTAILRRLRPMPGDKGSSYAERKFLGRRRGGGGTFFFHWASNGSRYSKCAIDPVYPDLAVAKDKRMATDAGIQGVCLL